MAAVTSAIWGKEQLILLPVQPQIFTLETDPPGQVLMQSGMHAVVASGYIGINPTAGGFGRWVLGDDDDIFTWDVKQTVGPLWRRIQQVSASVAMAGIESRDADEVDHSQWVVAACTWDEVPDGIGKRIRLNATLNIQGQGNGWISLAYHFVATGDLLRMPTPDEISANLA